jgi:5-methylcytosine-specific restriction protein A
MAGRRPWADRGSRHERGYGAAWTKLRPRILERDRHLCQPCRAKGHVTPATEVHHIKAKAQGGTDDPGNLVSTCHACHEEADAANRGHRVRLGFDKDGWPVWDER